LEDWDPEFVALLARGRKLIRFDSTGVGESGGIAPNTVHGMAEIVLALLDALNIETIDLLAGRLAAMLGKRSRWIGQPACGGW
jgi:pimeloyl-ACP methyl ester carboxylesterase